MNVNELRAHPEYKVCMDKIRNYREGFEFTVRFDLMRIGQANTMKVILRDAVDQGLIESLSIGLSLEGVVTDEKFRRCAS